MRIKRQNDSKEIISLTSLMDILFILIVFFLATTTFQEEERDETVSLPDMNEAPPATSAAPKVVILNVREDGSYYLGSRPVDVAELQLQLATAYTDDENQKVLLRGDERALHGHVAAALLACKQAGFADAQILYDLPR